jgi:glycosyltransferase involved in cell wall biosynthesis
VDLLLLPQDFDDNSVKFLKYSFPTKVSEYMISGTPILVYGDIRTGLTQYALKEKWSYVVTENSKAALCRALTDLYNDVDLRSKLAAKAQQIAIEREDAITVRENFRKAFCLNNPASLHQQ